MIPKDENEDANSTSVLFKSAYKKILSLQDAIDTLSDNLMDCRAEAEELNYRLRMLRDKLKAQEDSK